jgi:cytochrome c biogenesis protein CcmG, thiol:disulfide interchange protein DsbE
MNQPPVEAAGSPEAAPSGQVPAPEQQPELESREQEEQGRSSPLMRFLRLVASALVVGLLVLLVWGLLSSSRGASFVRQIADGKRPPAPPFTLAVIWPHTETWPKGAAPFANRRLSLRELRGRPVVVNFFASWCVACKQEAPLLHAEAQARAGTVIFLGVDVQDLSGDAQSFARKYGINYVAVRDKSNAIYNAYGLTGVPETYFIDARGRAVAHIPGEATRTTLAQGIASIRSPRRGGTLPGGAHVKGP